MLPPFYGLVYLNQVLAPAELKIVLFPFDPPTHPPGHPTTNYDSSLHTTKTSILSSFEAYGAVLRLSIS